MTLLTGLQYRVPITKLSYSLSSYSIQWGDWKPVPVGTDSFSGPVQFRPEPAFQATLSSPGRGSTNYENKDSLMKEIARRLDAKDNVAVVDIKTNDFEYATARIQFRQRSGNALTEWMDLSACTQIAERVDLTEFRKKSEWTWVVNYKPINTPNQSQQKFDDLEQMSRFLSDKVKDPSFYKIEIHREKNV